MKTRAQHRCRRLLPPVILVTALLGCAAPLDPGRLLAADAGAVVDTLASAAMAAEPIPGMVVVVLQGDSVRVARGFGRADTARSDPIEPTTVFQLGSIGKEVLAALVLRLVEQSRLALDDPVIDWLPTFERLPRTLTVRHLLNHTAGIREIFTVPGYRKGIGDLDRPTEELVAILRSAPVDFEPGSRWSYSNSNYLILAQLVERIMGMPYEDALAEMFFRPLGLNSFKQCPVHANPPREARGHVLARGRLDYPPPENMRWIRGDGGLCANALDLARWQRLLATGRILRPETYRVMVAPTRLEDGQAADYGFGLSLVPLGDEPKIAHGGAMPGFTGTVAYYPAHALTLVVIANRGDVRTEATERRIARRLLGLASPPVETQPLAAEAAQRWIGTYDIGVFKISVVDRPDGIWLEMPRPGPTVRLRYVGGGRMVGDDDPDAYELVLEQPEHGVQQRLRLSMFAMHWYGVRTR
ncbi:MAG: serine hydrolase domain-containing protein [Casimicrobiaceae bacterium]